MDLPPTPRPQGLDQEPAAGEHINRGQPGSPVRQRLPRALCERERTRWYDLGAGSHLSFNPDLPLADQVVALATLTTASDQACATSLLAALPNQAEVTRLGAEALARWAHRLYAGPSYWNPLRPDLLAEQHLADTAPLPSLAAAAAELAAGQEWEASVPTQLLAELTRAAPNQPAARVALDRLLAAALPRIVDLAITSGPAELAHLGQHRAAARTPARSRRPARHTATWLRAAPVVCIQVVWSSWPLFPQQPASDSACAALPVSPPAYSACAMA